MDQIKVHSRRMQKSIDGNRNLFVGYITAGYPDEERFSISSMSAAAGGFRYWK